MSTNYIANPNAAVFEMPLGIQVVERRYTPLSCANDPTYKQDAAYFKGRKDRWITVRKAMGGEFDNMDATFWLEGTLVQAPQAWVRVTRHPTLGFRAVMVWRGSLHNVPVDESGYLALDSDDAVDFILDNMIKQGCANWPEMKDYLAKLERAKAIHNAQGFSNGGKVH